MEDWVYRNLKNYGNCFLDEKTYKKVGKKAILVDLKKHGFDCEIVKCVCSANDFKNNVAIESDYVICVKK